MLPIHDTIPSKHVPIMTWALIGVNLLVFLSEIRLGPRGLETLFYLFGIVPARYSHPEWADVVGLPVDNYWPFLTSMFLHGGWVHFVSNMWILWIFGDNVEDRMGPLRYLIFYLICGVAAGVVHYVTNPNSTVPTVGASGAIAGVMGAYLILYPGARVVTLVPVFFYPVFFEIPAFFFLGFWFLSQFWSGALSLVAAPMAGGIAWWAHVGGFVVGAVGFGLFLNPNRPPSGRRRLRGRPLPGEGDSPPRRPVTIVYRPDGTYYRIER
jgi:membrane associated rhomboid family serine protease